MTVKAVALAEDEAVWEALDALAWGYVCEIGITPLWKDLRAVGRYVSYDAVTRVFQTAVRVGILDHPAWGVYRIAQNLSASAIDQVVSTRGGAS